MPTFFDLQKYAATGIASPDMSAYDKARALSLFGGGKTKTLTDVPPLSFRANGTPLISWSMLGNGQQTGTPTPDAPIMPEFVGVRTAQLFDEEYPEMVRDTPKYRPIYVGHGTYTLSTTTALFNNSANIFLLSGSVEGGASTNANGVWNGNPRTVEASDGYITIAYRRYDNEESDPRYNTTMLNLGSTALPYEPYGYKIPITNAGQTSTVYLGQVQTVRKIGKVDLASLSWTSISSGLWRNTSIQNIKYVSSNEELGDGMAEKYNIHTGKGMSTATNCIAIDTSQISVNTGDSTVRPSGMFWYAFTTPETGIVNEPLCKIGDYADELSSEDAGVTIQTTKGQNTLTVDTELQPSSMTITYKG